MPIGRSHPRSTSLGREDGELLAKGEVLDQKVRPRRCEAPEPTQKAFDSGEHRDRMEEDGSGVNDVTGRDARYDSPCANRSLSNADGIVARDR